MGQLIILYLFAHTVNLNRRHRMKRIIAASAAVIIFAAFLPFVSAGVPSGAAEGPEPTAKADFLPQRDEKVSVKLLDDGKTAELNMRDYLIGVVAAEMPVKFQPEALKAQAVAARTYAIRRAARPGCPGTSLRRTGETITRPISKK
jgi:stage II sporulation protein D